jgi:predicted dehydrogenase
MNRNETRPSLSRRRFLKASAAATLTAASWAQTPGANDRIGIGIIGCGLMGRVHARNFLAQPDAQIVAVAETFTPRLDMAAQMAGGRAVRYGDFRRVLDNKDVDAVVISTPDHWHALMTMMACAAGKDVFVEKPLTVFAREGRWMIDVARRYKRVVQVGTQQRSGPHYQRARQLIQSKQLGEIVSVQCNYMRNVMPGFGNPPNTDPPPDLDWEMWLGPAPARAYNPNRAIYHFRWFWDYSGGQMTNLGQHSLDIAHWCLDLKSPRTVTSVGGRFFLKDNCEVPDTQDTIIEYPGAQVVCQIRESAACAVKPGTSGMLFHGTKGTMFLSRAGFEVTPDRKEHPNNVVARIIGGHPVGGPQPITEEGGEKFWTEPLSDTSGDARDQYVRHTRNFLDCIKSREQPTSDLESAHQISTACHLANISLRTGRKLRWDGEREEIVGDTEANQMLTRPYRSPWDMELKALGIA